jgi:hypothetical protein
MLTTSQYAATSRALSILRQHHPDELTVTRESERPRSVPPLSLSHRVPIDRKVRLAHRRLDACGASGLDSRRGLVQLAAIRGDKLLIDGVLASLGE